MNKKKIRFYFWMVQGYLRKHWLRAVVITILFFSALLGLKNLVPYVFSSQDDTFVEGMVGKYKITSLPTAVHEYLSYGLVKIDEQGNPVPHAAESIQAEDNGKKYVIKLRQDLHWHDGTQLTSHDLAYNLSEVTVERPDDFTLVFTLKSPFAPFPTLLTGPLIKITAANEPLGIGDYMITRAAYKGSDHLSSLELNSTRQTPKKIKIKFYPTEEEMTTALKLGQIHGMKVAQNNQSQALSNTVTYQKLIPRRFVGVFFQLDDPLVGGKDVTLRQALSAAIPEVPNEKPFQGPFPANSWAHVPYDNKFKYDVTKAQELLDKYKAANKSSQTELKIKISTLPLYKETAEHVATAWKALGIETEIEVAEKRPESFQALVIGQELPADPDQYALWHSTQKETNITKYTNLRVDKDLEDARQTLDQQVRKEKYGDFQKQITEDLPVIYLYQPYSSYVLLKKYNSEEVKNLKGFTATP